MLKVLEREGITIFGGFRQAAECIVAGEKAAELALPDIEKALQPHLRPVRPVGSEGE